MNPTPEIHDNRRQLLLSWIDQQIPSQEFTLSPASSDASFRSYWRVSLNRKESFIVMDAPPELENSASFVSIGQFLRASGIHTPKLFQWDLDLGFVLMEDLGNQLYSDALNADSADHLYADAMQTMSVMAALSHQDLPPYDATRLMDEMALFPHWLVERHFRQKWREADWEIWRSVTQLLCESALEQPVVFLHRDFHCRNLMVCSDASPGVLDFQDALAGPVTYDPVSLLKDCYIKWPRARVVDWLEAYRQRIEPLLPPRLSVDTWLRWFDFMGVQRHLKAAGIFARLMHRDQKPGYLADIPRTLAYIQDACERYAELSALGALLRQLPISTLESR